MSTIASDWPIFIPIMLVYIEAMRGFRDCGTFWRWLKGHRELHYLWDGVLKKELRSLRLRPTESNWRDYAIVISHMPFFQWVEVYGRGRDYWSVSVQENKGAEPTVFLEDKRGRSIQESLAVIGRYQSLQAMLERINQLEQELESKQGDLDRFHALALAIFEVLLADRVRYRSKFSEGLRLFLERTLRSMCPGIQGPRRIFVDKHKEFLQKDLLEVAAKS